jgi:hypothetical protein
MTLNQTSCGRAQKINGFIVRFFGHRVKNLMVISHANGHNFRLGPQSVQEPVIVALTSPEANAGGVKGHSRHNDEV